MEKGTKYAFFEMDIEYTPSPSNDNGIWGKADDAKNLLADILCDVHPEHSRSFYLDRIIFCDINSTTHAVCCLANSGENEGHGTFNVVMNDGDEYLYFEEDGTPMINNSSDEFKEEYYRIHMFNY